MRIKSVLAAVASTGFAVLIPASMHAASADPTGGCYGGTLWVNQVAGTGSYGSNVQMNGNLAPCSIPGTSAIAASINLSTPRPPGLGGSPANGTINWSSGEVSNIDGMWQFAAADVNTVQVLNISSGPNSGNHLALTVRSRDNILLDTHPEYTVVSATLTP